MSFVNVGGGLFINTAAVIKLLTDDSGDGPVSTVTRSSGRPLKLDAEQSAVLLDNVPHLLSLGGGLRINPAAITEIQLITSELLAEEHHRVTLTLIDGEPLELDAEQSAEFLKRVQVAEQTPEPSRVHRPTMPPPWKPGRGRYGR